MHGWRSVNINANTYFHFIRLVVVVFLSIGIFSCTSTRSSIKEDVDVLDNGEDGYLLMSVDLARIPKNINILGRERISLTWRDLRPGTNYFLIKLKAGDYYISKVDVNNWYYYRLGKDDWSFKIEQGVISYVGDFVFHSKGYYQANADMELENNSSKALKFMEKNFSNILSARKLRYHGPGKDDFLSYIEQLEQGEAK